jgi:hypothetical protein
MGGGIKKIAHKFKTGILLRITLEYSGYGSKITIVPFLAHFLYFEKIK